MFDRHDRQFVKGTDPSPVIAAISGVLAPRGYQLMQVGPATWQGRGPTDGGLANQVTITCMPQGDGQWVEIHQSSTLDGTNVLIFIVLVVVFWPAAAVLGYLAWQGVQTRQGANNHALYHAMGPMLAGTPGGAFGPPMGPPAAGAYGPPAGGGYGPPPAGGYGPPPGWGPPR